ncbi:hypothetical protein DFJ77DRAFT_443742 [Powellomyces hirtus]|nr:hypothetical protein DFJ77DRAFT_443742 [Powellomyces hirtus]
MQNEAFDREGGRRNVNVYGSMPTSSFMHEISLPQYGYGNDHGPISESVGGESILNENVENDPHALFGLSPPAVASQPIIRRDVGAPVRKGLPHSSSFMADRIAMKRGESDGNLLSGGLHQHVMRGAVMGIDEMTHAHARSNSADLLTLVSSRNTLSRKNTMRIRETLSRRGDSIASLFRSKSSTAAPDGDSRGNPPSTTMSDHYLHQLPFDDRDRKASVDSANLNSAGSTSRMQGWGSTLMRKARGTVAPETPPPPPPLLKKKTSGSSSPGQSTMGRSSTNRSNISDVGSQSSDSSYKRYSTDGGDGEDDGDLDSTMCSIDDLQQWISTSSLGSLYVPKTLQMFVEHRGESMHTKVQSHGTVSDAIQGMLADMVVASGGNFHVENDRFGYRLCKLDRQVPGVRIWMDAGAILGSYDFMSGDEVRLRHVTDVEQTTVIVPPSTTPHPFKYGFNMLVKDAVASLKAAHLPSEDEGRYGLYYPRLGIWLEDSRTVFSYDLQPEKSLELRALANQFLLRIYISEFDQKIALKVLPGLRASGNVSLLNTLPCFNFLHEQQSANWRNLLACWSTDVIAMIHYQLRNRKLTLAHLGGRYGLFIPSRKTWMKESATLGEYETVGSEDVQYKLQYELVSIRLDLPPPTHSRIHDSSQTIQTPHPPSPLALLVDNVTTVETLVETIGLSNPLAAQDTFLLFSPAGDRCNEKDLVWTAMKDLAAGDALRYRAMPKKVILSNTLDKDVKLDLDIDYSRPVATIWSQEGGCGWDKYGRWESLDEQCITPGTKLIVQVSPSAGPRYSCSPASPSSDASQVQQQPPSPTTAAPPTPGSSEATNIWEDDGPDDIQLTKDASGKSMIGSGTLNRLIERLTDEKGEGTSIYLEYVRTFLLTYQSFATGALVLRKLIERYHAPRNRKSTFASYDHFRLTIQLRVCNVFLQWVKRHPNDFIKPKDGKEFWEDAMRFTENVLAWDQSALARQIRRNLVKMVMRMLMLRHYCPGPGLIFSSSSLSQKDGTHPALAKHLVIKSSGRGEIDPRRLSVFRYPVEEIAQQLTIIEHAFLADILPAELLNQAWSKPDAEIKAPNINALTRRFNAVACWTAKSVLEMKTPRARAKRVSLLIDIASHLLTLNNFSTLMAVIAGLNKAAISRLKMTFKEVGSKNLKKLNEMERLMTAEGSYRNYRSHIKTVTRPCIPYIGVYLIDLTYMEDGNPDFIAHRINFTKRQMISGVINEIAAGRDR